MLSFISYFYLILISRKIVAMNKYVYIINRNDSPSESVA